MSCDASLCDAAKLIDAGRLNLPLIFCSLGVALQSDLRTACAAHCVYPCGSTQRSYSCINARMID